MNEFVVHLAIRLEQLGIGSLKLGNPLAILVGFVALVIDQFLHGGVAHLIANMVALFVFGALVEDRLHHIRFTILLLVSGIAAALLQGAMFPESTTALIGASGAIAGVMGAYLVLYPRNRITLLTPIFLPVKLRAWVIIVVWVVVQVFMSQSADADSGVAWWAHIGGFIVGVVAGGWYRRVPV